MAARRSDEGDRRSLSELALKYELHPEFRDVYVEGEWEKKRIRWVLGSHGVSEYAVYDIDTVDLPSSVLRKYSLAEGKKGRIVALAYELQGLVPDYRQVTCIADRDYDLLLGINHSSPLLLLTDYSCQESYYIDDNIFDKFFDFVLCTNQLKGSQFLKEMLPVLQELHLIRAVNLSLGFALSLIPVGKCVDFRDNKVTFNTEEFIRRSLNKNARAHEFTQFMEELRRLGQRVHSDARFHINKHDMFDLMAAILSRFCRVPAFHQPEFIGRALAGCIELPYLAAQPLYQRLAERLK